MTHDPDFLDSAVVLAKRLADAAAAEIRPRFRQNLPADRKADRTPVTEADRAAERVIWEILSAERPDDGVMGEEYGVASGRSGLNWVIDPIDGTKAFITGRATFVTLIALLDGDRPILGLIDQPIAGDRWIGVAGRASLFNGQPIHTRPCAALDAASFSTTGADLFPPEDEPIFRAISGAASIRTSGGDGYAYGLLAAGWIDIVLESGLKLHDFAALAPVVEGAGGRMTDWAGAPLRAGSDGRVLASGDPDLHEKLLERIRQMRQKSEKPTR